MYSLLYIHSFIATPAYKLKHSEQIFFGVLLLLGFCISIIYKCNLKAMLTAQRVDIPFETLEELLKNDDYTLFLHIGTVLMTYAKVCHRLRSTTQSS